MVLFTEGGSTPPAPGIPSTSSSSNYLAGLSQETGIPLSVPTSGGSATQHFPYVYLGTKYEPNRPNSPDLSLGKRGARYSDRHPTVEAQQAQFANSGNDNIHHWAYLLALAGYAGAMSPEQAAEFSKQTPLAEVYKLHLDFLYDAADQYGHGQKITPQEWLSKLLKYRLGDAWDGKLDSLSAENAGALGSGGAGKTRTQTSKSVDFMSPEDAKGLVRAMLQQQLGRDPTQAEYEDFLATIHAAERSNPSTSKTTFTADAEGNVSKSTTSRGGLSDAGMDQILYEKAKKMPSWAIWQAVGTYAPALYAALDAPV